MARIIAGLIGLLIFGAPLFAGIMNLGNIPGLALSVLLLAWGIFDKQVRGYAKKLWAKKTGKFIITAVGCTAAAVFLLVCTESVLMINAAMNAPDKSGTTLVVLGCKVNGTQPSQMLRSRIDAAEKYLRDHPEAKAVLSGGKGSDEEISEAECMFNCLTREGIDPSRLYPEDKSTSTKENIAFSADIIEKNRLGTQMALVTNEFHIYRASLSAKEAGLKSFAVPAPTPAWLFFTYVFREFPAIVYEWFT